MGTILTALVIIYCIVAVFILIEKKSHAMSSNDQQGLKQDDTGWTDACEKGHRLSNFATGLSDTPTSKIPCRPLEKIIPHI
jgi:hypothetical protein